jgi:hypothetical protein
MSSTAAQRPHLTLGLGAIALAVAFNVPFSMLAQIYDYPDVLRRPAGEALAMFAAGGPTLILVWYGFMLTALALAILAPGLAVTPARLATRPAVAIGAALAGALAGLAQAIGLSRWVFAVPAIAGDYAASAADEATRAAAVDAFDLLNAWGGVAIGEHIGQLLTAVFVAQMARLQWAERARVSASLGAVSAVLLLIGTGEGVALAIGAPGEVFALITIAGFLGLTVWLIATGVGLIRQTRG